jgi:tRNA nucleotidyltransferase (CCA-adding enzyme)
MDAELVELSVLGKIVPPQLMMERLDGIASRLVEKVQRYYDDLGVDVTVKLAGSYAKGTYLSDQDLDLFMLFPPSIPRKEMEDIGLKAGRDIIGGELVYSEHPYTTGHFEGVEVDMVPCYRLESTEDLRTAVDRTPFHTEYINSHLDLDQKDQVRLLKRFMKGIGAYGAEQDSRGFSGYICEVLVVRYGSFRNVLEAAVGWESGETIWVEEKGPHFKSALVIYDPVDRNRNAASSVHEDTLELFKRAAAAYLSDPCEKFFFPTPREPLAPEELEWICSRRGSRLASIAFYKPEGVVDDNLQGQLWRTQNALVKKFGEFDFRVLNAVHMMDDSRMYVAFELESDRLSDTFEHRGPPARVEKASHDFLEYWKGNPYGEPYQKDDGYWYVISPRQITVASEFLEKQTACSGIGANLDPDTKTVYDHVQTLYAMDAGLLTQLLDPKDPWEI